MKTLIKITLLIITTSLLIPSGYPKSVRGHLINMGENLVELIGAPLYGAFVQGPKNVKNAYEYEAWGREKPEKRGLLRYKLLGIWRAPSEESKAIIDGLVGSVEASAKFLKNFLSIFFSD